MVQYFVHRSFICKRYGSHSATQSYTHKGLRDKYPPAAHMTGTPLGSMYCPSGSGRALRIVFTGFGTIDHEVHRKRRAAISPFFSKSTVASTEPMIHDKMRLLCQRLKQTLAVGGVVELRRTYLAIATDTLSGHAFQKSLGLIEEDHKAHEWKRTIKAVAILTPLIKQFTWIIPLALKLPLGPLEMVVPDLARIVALHGVSIQALFPLYSCFVEQSAHTC